eukprot:GFYU01002158.1.p1 GENE.GFYU01002158.1~~GFYU01002158.1.p1  ORF type:complete len:276 (+),score=13.69 GFYU01002158.1:97-828(+)
MLVLMASMTLNMVSGTDVLSVHSSEVTDQLVAQSESSSSPGHNVLGEYREGMASWRKGNRFQALQPLSDREQINLQEAIDKQRQEEQDREDRRRQRELDRLEREKQIKNRCYVAWQACAQTADTTADNWACALNCNDMGCTSVGEGAANRGDAGKDHAEPKAIAAAGGAYNTIFTLNSPCNTCVPKLKNDSNVTLVCYRQQYQYQQSSRDWRHRMGGRWDRSNRPVEYQYWKKVVQAPARRVE